MHVLLILYKTSETIEIPPTYFKRLGRALNYAGTLTSSRHIYWQKITRLSQPLILPYSSRNCARNIYRNDHSSHFQTLSPRLNTPSPTLWNRLRNNRHRSCYTPTQRIHNTALTAFLNTRLSTRCQRSGIEPNLRDAFTVLQSVVSYLPSKNRANTTKLISTSWDLGIRLFMFIHDVYPEGIFPQETKNLL